MVPKWPAQSALPRPGLHKASGNTTSAPRLPRGTGRGHGDTAGPPAAVVDPRTLPIEDGYMTGSWRHWRTRGGGRRPEVPGAAANVPASTSKLLFFSAGDAIPPCIPVSWDPSPVRGGRTTHSPGVRRPSRVPKDALLYLLDRRSRSGEQTSRCRGSASTSITSSLVFRPRRFRPSHLAVRRFTPTQSTGSAPLSLWLPSPWPLTTACCCAPESQINMEGRSPEGCCRPFYSPEPLLA